MRDSSSSKASSLFILLTACLFRLTVVAAQPACPSTLDLKVEIDSSATLYYAVIPVEESGNGLLCGRLEVENDGGWIGLGFSDDGMMSGSQAVIGIPAEGTVLKYDLTSAATPMDDDRQTLTGTSISAGEDGMVVMEFVKLLVEEGEVPILVGENRFIQARGPAELGYHTSGRISIVAVLEGTVIADDADVSGTATSTSPTYISTSEDTAPGPTPVINFDQGVDAPIDILDGTAVADDADVGGTVTTTALTPAPMPVVNVDEGAGSPGDAPADILAEAPVDAPADVTSDAKDSSSGARVLPIQLFFIWIVGAFLCR